MAKNTFDILEAVVDEADAFPGWVFELKTVDGALRFFVHDTKCVDAYNPEAGKPLRHEFPVPTATYNRESWERWVHTCCLGVLTHELGEWFRFGERRPFAPCHGPGENPYVVTTYRDPAVAFITQDGSVRPNPEERIP